MTPLLNAQAVFFDLDGTLADTAPDLAAPVNAMREERGLAPLPLSMLRPFASMGARGLLGRGLDVRPEDERYEALRVEFIARYERDICVRTQLFDGMDEVLRMLERSGIRWGIVSNKAERLVRPLLSALQLDVRSATAIGGDTAGFAKPHPAPLLLAATQVGIDPAHCAYVGDDARDIQAGQAAGMSTIAAGWGYHGADHPIEQWGSDVIAGTPGALLPILGLRRL